MNRGTGSTFSSDWPAYNHPATIPPGLSKFYPERCEELIDAMSHGYSQTAAAALMGVTPGTLLAWADRHPEFAEALKMAKAHRVLFFERRALETQDAVEAKVALTALSRAAREDWGPATEGSQIESFSLVDVLRKIHEEQSSRRQIEGQVVPPPDATD